MALFPWIAGGVPVGMDPASVKRIKFPKSPTDVTPVTGDFRGALASIDNDALNPAFVPQTTVYRNDGGPPDMAVIGTPAINNDNTRVTLWLAAGTAGYEYLVLIVVQSQDGQTLERSFIMPVFYR